VRAPITVILGGAPHPAAPDDAELATLAPLGARLRIVRLAGVGHFPHEEAPAEVAARITGRAVPD
jgi:pimeloyl-ACP methyl ester carboxylesterase